MTARQRSTNVVALVDSGAYCSVFPLRVALALGFTREELTAEPDIDVVGGQAVPAFSAPERIYGQLRVDRDGSTFLWGPQFVLNALFVQYEDNLLGRIDFFNVFNVVFASEGPTMHIYDL